MLPFFRRLEADCDFAGPLHGSDGPIPIRRQHRRDWSALAVAVQEAAGKLGFPDVDDMNAVFHDGHCALPISRYEHSRALGRHLLSDGGGATAPQSPLGDRCDGDEARP